MWKKLTTSKQDELKDELRAKLSIDNGLIDYSPSRVSGGGNFVTEERLMRIFPVLEQYINFWIQYPDKFVELLSPTDTQFKLYPFQILTVRAAMRYQRFGLCATRGFSKSFIAVLVKEIKCILLPGTKESLVATTKQQAAEIGSAKIKEISSLLPLLDNEIDYRKGSGTTFGQDYTRIRFKGTSELDIVGVSETTRGNRRNGMIFEESAKMNAISINEVVLPLLNIARRTKDGTINPNEIHQQQTYVTSAGNRQSFGYDKTIEILISAVLEPQKNFTCGFDYQVPMYYGLIDKSYIESFKTSNTYDESSFAREYGSKWTSTVEGSLFDYEKLSGLRTIKRAEWKAYNEDDVFYIATVDVARHKARSVIEIIKVRKGREHFTKSVVNIILMEGRNFLYQAARIKELDMMFNFDWIAIDANGLGVGLVDFLMAENTHPQTGQIFPSFNVRNIKEYSDFAIDQKIGAPMKIWVIKTNQHSAGKVFARTHFFPSMVGVSESIAC